MGLSKYNASGYKDHTCYEALNNILAEQKQQKQKQKPEHKTMPRVFICSPYAGDIERNAANAVRYCSFAVSKRCIPFAPHIYFPQFLDESDPAQREKGIFMGISFLTMCREIWVFGKTVSKGMRVEIDHAKKYGIRIRFFGENCKEVQKIV